jgi:AraC family transcriptional regulator
VQPAAPSYCRPTTTAWFAVENAWATDGIAAEIRHFGWTHSGQGTFRANATYIDYALGPRSAASRLLTPGAPATPPPGASVFLPQGSEFTAQIQPSEQHLLCLTYAPHRAQALFNNGSAATDLEPCFDVRAPQIRPLFARLAAELRAPGFAHAILLESLALTLAVELCRYLRRRHANAPTNRMPAWRLKRLQDRIEAGLSGDLSIPALAAACGLSPRHLVRTFKATTGVTLTDCIAQARLHRARQALMQPNTPIKAIAHHCGFTSQAAFSAAFRKATGATPSAFRQEYRR